MAVHLEPFASKDDLTDMIATKTLSRGARLAAIAMALSLAACASHGPDRGDNMGRNGAVYKVGKPYQINGVWYYPKEDYSYDETGIASWYGADFHLQRTANGDIFNKNELTAAHPTLPMPSLARVTNLENGRSIVVRINDRGPFSGARIIDVTQRAAQLLGFEGQGTAKVRVQVLADESKAIADAMRRYGSAVPGGQAASAAPPPLIASAAPAAAVETQTLDAPEPDMTTPLPRTRGEAKAMMGKVSPLPIARQLPLTGQTQIYIQAGAFSKLDNANRLRQKVGKIAPAHVSEVVVKGAKFYRVRLGPIPDVATADTLLKRVKKAGAETAKTVVDTPEK